MTQTIEERLHVMLAPIAGLQLCLLSHTPVSRLTALTLLPDHAIDPGRCRVHGPTGLLDIPAAALPGLVGQWIDLEVRYEIETEGDVC